MTSPFIPCSFSYGDAPQGGVVMPMVIAGRNPSNTTDKNNAAGYLWLSSYDLGGSGNLYVQSGNVAGVPNWTAVTAGAAGALNTLSDGSTTVSPTGGNISIISTPNQVTSTSSAPSHEIVLSIPSVFIAPGSIASTSTMTVGSNLSVVNSATIGNDLTVTDDVSIGGDLAVTGTITFAGLTVAGTVQLNVTGSGTTTIGSAAAGAITIDVGTGNFALNGGGNTVGIANDSAANLVTVGSTNGVASLTLQAGTGDMVLTGATTTAIAVGSATQTGLLTFGRSTDGQDIDIGSAINTSAQVIDIANGNSAANSTVRILSGTGTAGAGTLLLGNNTRVTVASLADIAPAAARTVTVGGGTITTAITDTVDIGPDGATTNASAVKSVNINTGGVTLGQVLTNIATGAVTSGTHTTAIATGNRAAGTMAVNLLTGTGTKTLSVGNTDGGTTSTFLGPHNVNASQNNNTNINTGTSTGTVAIGNSLATAITADAVAISLDSTANSNFTVTGAGADLTLSSAGGSVLVESTENAALAIRLHADGGTSETIQIHSDQGTGVSSVGLLSDVGGITLRAAGLASADAINLEAVAGGVDVDAALQINIASSQAAANALVITASNAAGGIDITTGGGSVDISSSGFVTVAPAVDTQATPTAASTINTNVGAATFTGFTTASAASQVFTITNSLITTSSKIFVTACNEGTNDAQMTVMRVKRIAGSMEVTLKNNGAAALNGNVTVSFWIIAA